MANKASPPLALTKFNPKILTLQWKPYLKTVGVEKGYKDFKTIYSIKSQYVQHSAMHIIGGLLFQIEGMKGIEICDDSFTYGCYHGFFGEAIKKHGLSTIEEMEKGCDKYTGPQNSACQHGIGHGILSFLGSTKLENALDACDKLSWSKTIGGCKAGVFMEYNFNTLSDLPGSKLRKRNNPSPYFPCNVLSEKHQYACYFDQADWWVNTYKKNFNKIAAFCEDLSTKNQESCYLGMGNVAVRYWEFNSRDALKQCDLITTTQGNILCKAGAQWTYRAYGKDHHVDLNESDIFCNQLPSSQKEICLKKMHILN